MTVKTNPDEEYVALIRKRLKENGNYCPCRLEKTEDTKCMCKEFRDMLVRGEEGMCHCRLYIVKND